MTQMTLYFLMAAFSMTSVKSFVLPSTFSTRALTIPHLSRLEFSRDDNETNEIRGPLATAAPSNTSKTVASTGTVNERLQRELNEAQKKQSFPMDPDDKKNRFLFLGGARKTPEEREAAIAEARNLNGINPLVPLAGGVITLGVAAVLWYGTTWSATQLGIWQVDSDLYVVQRVQSLVRNVVVGILALGSGFCGVTGLGLVSLGVQVGMGVMQGTLDPTPLPRPDGEEATLQLPNVWEYMTLGNKRRRRTKK